MRITSLLYELDKNTDHQWDETIAPSLYYSMDLVQFWNTVQQDQWARQRWPKYLKPYSQLTLLNGQWSHYSQDNSTTLIFSGFCPKHRLDTKLRIWNSYN